jgi:hypothetical protein
MPNPGWYALRNFSTEFPRSLSVDLVTKAAIAAGATTDATWAGPLAAVQPLAEGFVELARARTLIGRLGLRRVPMLNASMPVETTGAVFAWVGENKPKLLSAPAFATLSLPWAKTAGIIAVSDELLRFAQPGNEASLRDVLIKGTQLVVDTEFLRSNHRVLDGTPGGVGEWQPGGGGIGHDAGGLRDRPPSGVQRVRAGESEFRRCSARHESEHCDCGRTGDEFHNVAATGGSLFGVPTVTTAAIGNKVLLFDTSQAIYGDDPTGVRIDVSRHASVMLDSVPSDPTVPGDIFHGLWQRGLVAFKAEYAVRWKLARTDAARVITGCAYV